MRNIIKFDTSVGSLNVGDQIINRSFNREMSDLLDSSFVISVPTHTPATHFYQNVKMNSFYKFALNSDYKFIIGTNILCNNMLKPWHNWNVNIFNCGIYKESVLAGCGFGNSIEKINFYTRFLYSKILSKKLVHSVRDERTKLILEKYGYKAINTGCPTMWMLNNEHCKKIPKDKKEEVIFTLTDYDKNFEKDQLLINILKSNYKKIYYWIQGSGDLEYLKKLNNIENIEIVGPSLTLFEKILSSGKVDYVGTRLHAGIFAMQHFVRSIILIVDNRARDMKKTYNLVAIERNDISELLEEKINSVFETTINIDEESIVKWKSQFEGDEYE